jgi:hypothetical protein
MTPDDRRRPPGLVTFDLWTVPAARVPAALRRMATDRVGLRRVPGLRFAKLLGTGRGRTFTLRDADPRRWALVGAWDDPGAAAAFERSGLIRGWWGLATERWRADLRPLASRGRWSRQAPFGEPPFGDPAPPSHWSGPVAAITRARLSLRAAPTFWRAVPPVSADLARCPGLRFAVGIGEAPLGLQGTFSAWDDARALRAFAYGRPAHAEVIRRTAAAGWYAEELFSRFAVLGSRGTVDGIDPLTVG